MKTTKRSVLTAKIEKMKFASNSVVGKMLREFLATTNTVGYKFRPIFTRGTSWKSSSLENKEMELRLALDKLGIEYTTGNDAPKGGRTGYYIEVKTKILD